MGRQKRIDHMKGIGLACFGGEISLTQQIVHQSALQPVLIREALTYLRKPGREILRRIIGIQSKRKRAERVRVSGMLRAKPDRIEGVELAYDETEPPKPVWQIESPQKIGDPALLRRGSLAAMTDAVFPLPQGSYQ